LFGGPAVVVDDATAAVVAIVESGDDCDTEFVSPVIVIAVFVASAIAICKFSMSS
jgi:hypothetical protein